MAFTDGEEVLGLFSWKKFTGVIAKRARAEEVILSKEDGII